MKTETTLNVNGLTYEVVIDAHATLAKTIREVVGLTGTKEGCDDSECGACMMLIDGKPVNSCSYFALQASGSAITTVEGLSDGDELSALQKSFLACGGVQCGFCTPGMLISATSLLAENPNPTEDEVRIGLSGNLCRCTGYDGIVKAVLDAANS
jgi:aerobic-type carbon monoxide dehydrogenase small subunit (CoxS/CutS family)